MAFFHCSIEFSNAVNHIMVIRGNFIHSGFYNVSGMCCSNMVNYRRSGYSDPGRSLNKLFEAEQLIEISVVVEIRQVYKIS